MRSRRSNESYEIQAGRKTVGSVDASTAQEALVLYLRARGCRDDEISRRSTDSVSWRGALYRAVPTESS